MEVLGATAAADQLLKEAFKLVQLIRTIHDKYKGAPKEIEAWRQEIKDFSELIKHIETLPGLEEYNIHGTIESCKTTCCELIGIFSGLDFADGDKRLHKTWMAIKGIDQEPVVKKHFEKLQRLKETLLIKINVSQSAQDVQFIKTAIQPGTEEDQCLKSLYLTNPIDDRDAIVTAKGAKVAGTCEWITSTDEYKAWIASPPSLLWLSGGPGKGKTFISIFLTEHLSPSADVIYFFCDNKVASRNTAIAIIRGLLYQLVSQFPQLSHHVLTPWKVQQGALFNSNSLESLWRIFQEMLEDLRPDLICILDGLDECTEDSLKSLLQKIKVLFTENAEKHKPRLVILSRRSPECLERTLGSFPQIDLDSGQISNQADINTYITSRVTELAQRKGISTRLVKHIEKIFRKKSENTFLWVSFMADDLETKTVPDIEKALQTLPTGLNEVYERILLHIAPENTTIIASMLRWISLAMRPLTVPELAEAMKIHETNFLSKEDICLSYIKSCGHLLQISAPSNDDASSEFSNTAVTDDTLSQFSDISRNDIVTFVHQSVKDYLFGLAKHHTISAFQINKEQDDLGIACQLLYSMQNEWLQRVETLYPWSRSSSVDAHPLAKYAQWNWKSHLQQLQDRSLWLLINRNPSFFADFSAVRSKWCFAMSYQGFGSVDLLRFACRFELLALVKKLLKHKRLLSPFMFQRYINRRGRQSSFMGSVLADAIDNGNTELTQLLLSYKVNIETPCSSWDNDSALHYATKMGKFEIFQLFAETKRGRRIIDADIKACQNSAQYSSLLHYAAQSGSLRLCSILIERYHYNVEDVGYRGQTPICSAIESGCIDLARMFVKNWGASLAAAYKILKAAIWSHNTRKMLGLVVSEFKVNINSRDESGQTVLHFIFKETLGFWGWAHSSYGLLVYCISLGADPSLRSTNEDSPLHTCEWFDFAGVMPLKPIMFLLRDGRLGVNDKGNGGDALLHKVMHSASRNSDVAKTSIRSILASLLDFGADRTLANSDGLTALQLAKKIFDEGEHNMGTLADIVDILENYTTVSNQPQRLNPFD